jgi:hypothetical protein
MILEKPILKILATILQVAIPPLPSAHTQSIPSKIVAATCKRLLKEIRNL